MCVCVCVCDRATERKIKRQQVNKKVSPRAILIHLIKQQCIIVVITIVICWWRWWLQLVFFAAPLPFGFLHEYFTTFDDVICMPEFTVKSVSVKCTKSTTETHINRFSRRYGKDKLSVYDAPRHNRLYLSLLPFFYVCTLKDSQQTHHQYRLLLPLKISTLQVVWKD